MLIIDSYKKYIVNDLLFWHTPYKKKKKKGKIFFLESKKGIFSTLTPNSLVNGFHFQQHV